MSIYNPETGRKIKRNGPTFKRLVSEGKIKDGKTLKAKGWKKISPKQNQREYLKSVCGDKCFLDPSRNAFPVCKACKGKCSCTIDCRGVQAAYMRARQWHYPEIAKKAQKLKKTCK